MDSICSVVMADNFERRSRLVILAYRVINGMAPPPEGLSDRDVLLAIASEALKRAAEDIGPPKLEPPREGLPAFIRYRHAPDDEERD